MKKFLQRFFGIVVSAALVVSSGMTTVFAADPGHSHGGGTSISTAPDPAYTITLTHPDGNTTFNTDSCYGAYQIFSGTVKENPDSYTDPGSNGTEIPLTDIKWGNAFGIVGTQDDEIKQEAYDKNIVDFVIALAEAPTGAYSYAFSDFDGFNDVQDSNNKESAFIKKGTDGKIYLADRFVSGEANINGSNDDFSAVNFDKLAVAVADVLAAPSHVDDHEWLQAFNDILGGYAQSTDGYAVKGYVDRFYEGSATSDSKSYEIKVPAGYYMIRDLSSFEGEQSKSYSARMLFVANNVTQFLKEGVPELDKEILRDDAAVGSAGNQTEVAGVGDVVHFQLEGTLPSNYELYLGGYQYTFIDKLSNGLDLVQYTETAGKHEDYVTDKANDCVKVTVKGLYKWDTSKGTSGEWTWVSNATAEIPVGLYEHSASSGSDPSDHHLGTGGDKKNYNYHATYAEKTLTVEFPCLREIRIKGTGSGTDSDAVYRLGYKGEDETAPESINSSKIYVDYYAKVNDHAIVSPTNGNKNQAQIKYSDNPQSYADTDTTTINNATVYIFGFEIIKIDAAEFLRNDKESSKSGLAGAQFVVLRRNGTSADDYQWQIASFKWVDALTATTNDVAPDSFKTNGYNTIFEWNDIGDKGSKDFDESWLIDTYQTTKDDHTGYEYYYNITSLTTETKGALNVSGLDVGVEYTIVETKTPDTDTDKYAKIAPFTITLSAAKFSGEEYSGCVSEDPTITHTVSGSESFTFDKFVKLLEPITGNPDAEGTANMLVANFKYIDLPSTGGVGTVWFYILGGGVLALSGVLFFLSKKKSTK